MKYPILSTHEIIDVVQTPNMIWRSLVMLDNSFEGSNL